jgi:hypothetical protein
MAMHSQNMNRSGDLRVDDHGQFPESEVFLNYLHSDEYSQTLEAQGFSISSQMILNIKAFMRRIFIPGCQTRTRGLATMGNPVSR